MASVFVSQANRRFCPSHGARLDESSAPLVAAAAFSSLPGILDRRDTITTNGKGGPH
jgi:hypothetical protein